MGIGSSVRFFKLVQIKKIKKNKSQEFKKKIINIYIKVKLAVEQETEVV